MKNYTKNEFENITNTITDTIAQKDPKHRFAVTISVRLPDGRVATNIVATAPTYEEARALIKRVESQFGDKVDFVSVLWLPELVASKEYIFPMQK